MKLKINSYYKVNWYTKDKPEYGYFRVTDRIWGKEHNSPYCDKTFCYVIDECNPWGGVFIQHKRPVRDIHFKNSIEVPATEAAKYIYFGLKVLPRRDND